MIVDLPRDADREILFTAARDLGIDLLSYPSFRQATARDVGPVLRAEGVRLALGNDRDNYRAIRNGRRINAVSWTGHRDWMRAVFAAYPTAVIRTSLDTWAGSEDFEARHAATDPDPAKRKEWYNA